MIADERAAAGAGYEIGVGIGYDELYAGNDTFQQCQQRADHKLYLDKEYCKLDTAAGT